MRTCRARGRAAHRGRHRVSELAAVREHLWTQREAADFLSVTPRYLRESSCPKILLPGNGVKGQPLVRYDPDDVRAWARSWHTDKRKAG